jgi:hypothetical protein
MAQDPSEVRAAIEDDRQALADTVQALAHKADVKARVRETVAHNSDELQRKASDAVSKARDVTPDQVRSGWGSVVHSARARPLPFALGGAFLFGLLVGQSRRRRQ